MSKPLHILMAANDTTFIYNLRREVLQAMIESGYRVTVMAQVLNFEAELRALGCEIIDVKTARQGKNPFKDIVLFSKYYQALKNARPDLMFGNNIKPNVYAGLACKRLKIKYIPNITGLGTPVENPGPLQKLTIQMYKAGVSGASCIFFQNAENQRFFEVHNMMPKKAKVRLLPGSGVNLQAHPAFAYPKDDIIHFQYTSRILKEKGIDLYLAAAKRIHAQYPNTVFHICGGCDDERYIEILKQAQRDGYIVWHGQQKDMNPYLKQAACIVHPSYYPEGMSNVLLEGAAAARPIIATDRAGCRETVEDGVTGFLIPIKDEEALVQALEKFMKMLPEQREKMGLAGRAKMEREFDRRIVAKAYLEEINEAVRSDRNG